MQFDDVLESILFNSSINESTLIEASIFKRVLDEIYSKSLQDSKTFSVSLLISLLIGSFLSSIANIFVIFIFMFDLNKNLNRELKLKKDTEHQQQNESEQIRNNEKEGIRENKSDKLFIKYNLMKKKLIFNANLKLFYTLVRYLAFIDLFTCSIAIPVTVYEIFNNMIINEFFCKIFEFIRAIGVIGSNFIIILIAVERYMAICKMKSIQLKLFKYCIFLIIFLSISISIITMLSVSVYQKGHVGIIFVGFCLKSQIIFTDDIHKIICYLVTSIFLISGCFTSFVYVLIFRKTFKLNKRNEIRKKNEKRLFKNAINNQATVNQDLNRGEVKTSLAINNIGRKLIRSEKNSNSCCCLTFNRNFRIASMILLVTFIYYSSIIPYFLTINGIIDYNPYIHYLYLLNSTVNPFVSFS
jgi:hypothetical protein